MRGLLLIGLCITAFAQSGSLGVFTHSGDVGGPARKGSTVFDEAKREYRITGSGANMWAKEDQFQFAWREMTGNFTVTATLEFLGQGNEHRKAGIVVRQTLDTDSPYVDLVIHGNGMPGVQWRTAKGDITNDFDLPFDAPSKYKLRLTRQGGTITAWIAKEGAELKEIGHTQISLGNPLLVGLAVCSHDANASETVVFTDVSVAQLAGTTATKKE